MTHIHDKILPAGTQIGVYEIKDAAKIGAFDIIYRAWNHHLKEWVKIQEYFPHDFAIRTSDGLGVEPKSEGDKENFEYGLKAFLDQAEILTQIEHPNIVVAENALQFNGTAYLMMGIQKGVSLSRLIQSPSTFAETELKFILVSILTALQKIHEHEIVHGGIQPAAILLGKDGEPWLTDFAAARLAIAARTAQLADELAAGYAPAEQYEYANKPGPATDFYALGATIYYCMTHHHPAAAQSRIIALSQGKSDPMASLSGSADTPYSAELLQAINWMLQPEYGHRPQSETEILALLKSEHTSDQAGSVTSKQAATDVANRNKNFLWIGVMSGIVALAAVGLWFDEKSTEILNDKPDTVIVQPLSQRNSDETTVTSETKEDQFATSAVTEPSQASGSDKIAQATQKIINEAEKQPTEGVSIPTSPSVIEPKSDRSQQLAIIDQSLSQSRQSNFPEKLVDDGSMRRHLAAAEKAMKAGRLTTPLKDNAYKYYQMVLIMDPDNAKARSGLQMIVDRYVQFIGKAKAEGRVNDVKLYLQRAESVLPDDPKLQDIRAELAAAKE